MTQTQLQPDVVGEAVAAMQACFRGAKPSQQPSLEELARAALSTLPVSPGSGLADDLIRPIIGIENRTAQEVFDIMCDRFRYAARTEAPGSFKDGVDVARVARSILHDKVYSEARERCIHDATGEDLYHHLIIVAAEYGIRRYAALSRFPLVDRVEDGGGQ